MHLMGQEIWYIKCSALSRALSCLKQGKLTEESSRSDGAPD
jgi:hypothetical protein